MRRAYFIFGLFLLIFLVSACTTAPALNQSITSMESDLDTDSIYAGTCTRGNTGCAYPGTCGQYIDLDGDSFCDR